MSFSQKKVIYGGLATACVALMVYTIAPEVVGNAERRFEAADATLQTVANGVAANAPVQAVVDGAPQKAQVEAPRESEAIARKDISDDNVKEFKAVTETDSAVPSPALKKAEMGANIADMRDRLAAAEPMEKSKAAVVVGGRAAVPPASVPAMPAGVMADYSMAPVQQEFGRDQFEHVTENAIHQVVTDPISTFSIDVDTASYSYARSSLNEGVLPQKDSVRVEEMVNYFNYDYPLPVKKEEPFSTNVVLKPSPWGDGKQLMTVGIKGYDIAKTAMPNSNLVFLLDTSGSMNEPNKLPLLKQSISMLLDSLKPTDTVAMVVYAGSAGTVLPPTKVADKMTILNALQNLEAGGGTAGAEGIRQAYQLAEMNFDKNAVNRVILGTDGDFNVGITDPEELKGFVSREKDKGIFLSVLGFGRGNYNDEMMQKLAQNGNGTAAYIDNINEARKVLVEEATKTLFPIAKDVKIQVEFNPATIAEYRLVGYETRALKTEDFNNDKVDAGDIGAGAEVTAIYELTPKGGKTAIDPSRYVGNVKADKTPASNELAFVKVRYKLPNENDSRLITTPVNARQETASTILTQETNWAVAVASFAQMLKGGTYTGKMTYDDVIALAEANKGADTFGTRAEFINLVRQAKTAAGLQAQPGNVVVQPIPVQPQPIVNYPYPVPAK